jgi:hypothetical protein
VFQRPPAQIPGVKIQAAVLVEGEVDGIPEIVFPDLGRQFSAEGRKAASLIVRPAVLCLDHRRLKPRECSPHDLLRSTDCRLPSRWRIGVVMKNYRLPVEVDDKIRAAFGESVEEAQRRPM